ncbi:class I adenylate-forming enzyme family protein [Amycolatopsis japonica]
MNIAEWLFQRTQVAPYAPAVYLGDELLRDYEDLSRRAFSLSRDLAVRGVRVDDRVAIWMGNHPSYLEVLFAIWGIGAVAVPLNAKLHRLEVRDICRACEATILFCDESHQAADFITTVDVSGEPYERMVQGKPISRPVRRGDQDLAWLFYTSGTTGRPKGAMLSFRNLRAMSYAYLADVDPKASDKAMLYAAPMSHGAGMYSLPQTLIGGAHVIPRSGGFDAEEILRLAGSGKLPPLSFFGAPTMVNRFVRAVETGAKSAEGIGLIVYGGGPMYAADMESAVSVLGNRFAQIYGQGEAPMTITRLPTRVIADRQHPRWSRRLGSVGVPHSCAEVKIVANDGGEAPSGTPGEILASGPMVMLGYWRNEEATNEAIADGWLRTGDVGFLDDDGYLTLTGRSKDVIISGGSNIYPREVEEVLLMHPDVEHASVVGVPNSEWGEIVVAFIVTRTDAPLGDGELHRHCMDHMARFKRPKNYVFRKALPTNAYGKVLKTKLREDYIAEFGTY